MPPSSFTAPLPAFMDSFYIDQSTEDSRQSRSRANSHLSSTAAQFQGLNIDTASSSNDQVVTSSDTTTLTTSPPNIIEQESQPSNPTFISAPTPQQYTPFPLLSQSDLDADWSYLNSSEEQSGSAPLLRLDPVHPLLGDQSVIDHQTTFRSHSNPAAMRYINSTFVSKIITNPLISTVGVQQYDGRFDAGVRQSYTWPRKLNVSDYRQAMLIEPDFDMGEPFAPHDLSPGMSSGNLAPYEDPKLIPIYARSLSSSPPRASLTPEQRELKRQRDHARRNSKTRIRRDRSTSNPYIMSQKTSPDLLPRTLPEYSSSLAPAPLLSQGSPTLASPAFLTPYSPHIPESGPSDMYGPVFTM